MLPEIIQAQKKNNAWYHLYGEIRVKLKEAESRMVVARGWREGEMGNCYPTGVNF